MCWWCSAAVDGPADYCPRCQRSFAFYSDRWVSEHDTTAVERCPRCEAAFTRFDDECPGCGQYLRTGYGTIHSA